MHSRKPDPLDEMASRISDLYVALEDFRHEVSEENRLKLLNLFGGLRTVLSAAEEHLGDVSHVPAQVSALAPYTGPLVVGSVYTRKELRERFAIQDKTLDTGIFRVKGTNEIWLFVTENKPADREQYVDKLSGDVLYWQGQKQGRKDYWIIDHRQNGVLLLLFYRTAKYQFEGAGFLFEGPFEYVSHSGSAPTSFVLRRQLRAEGLPLAIPDPVLDRSRCVGGVFVLPDSDDLPASFMEASICIGVASLVALDLGNPEVGVLLGGPVMVRAAVPEAPVKEDRHPSLSE